MPMKSIASILNSESRDEAEILLQIATLPEQQQPGQKIKLPSIKELLNQQPPAIYTPPASRSPSLPHTLPYQFPADRSPSGPTSAIHGIQSKESRFLPYSHRRANSANESPSFKSSPIMRPSSTEDVTAVKKEPYYYSYNPQVIQKAKKNEDSKRFDLLPNGTIAERHCGDCGNNRTSGHWCQDSLVVG